MAAAQAAEKKDSGPTQAQIDCKNRAVNDYCDQLKECDKALSDLPADNAMCPPTRGTTSTADRPAAQRRR